MSLYAYEKGNEYLSIIMKTTKPQLENHYPRINTHKYTQLTEI